VRYDCLEIVYDEEALPDEEKLIMYDGIYPVRWSKDSGSDFSLRYPGSVIAK
jgi:hypothetical protein